MISKFLNLDIIRKHVEYSLKKIIERAIFTLKLFEILPLEARTVLWPKEKDTRSQRVKISVKKLKDIRLLLELLENCLTSSGDFKYFSTFLLFCLTLSIPEKLKNPIFEISTTLNINYPSTLGQYYEPHSGTQKAKGLKI